MTNRPLWRNHLEQLLDSAETLSPGSLRAAYLHGSNSEGTAIPGSDVDLTVVVDGVQALGVLRPALSGRRLPGGEVLDAHVTTLDNLADPAYALIAAHVRHRGQIVRGQDLRAGIPEPVHGAFAARIREQAWRGIAMLRDEDEARPPLDFPDPSLPFFGYELARKARWYPEGTTEGTKELAAVASFCASAWVVTKHGVMVLSKHEAIEAIRRVEHGWRADTVEGILGICRTRYLGGVPTAEGDRRALRDLCPQFLELEREVLALR